MQKLTLKRIQVILEVRIKTWNILAMEQVSKIMRRISKDVQK